MISFRPSMRSPLHAPSTPATRHHREPGSVEPDEVRRRHRQYCAWRPRRRKGIWPRRCRMERSAARPSMSSSRSLCRPTAFSAPHPICIFPPHAAWYSDVSIKRLQALARRRSSSRFGWRADASSSTIAPVAAGEEHWTVLSFLRCALSSYAGVAATITTRKTIIGSTTNIATPMAKYPEYRASRRSFGINVLGHAGCGGGGR